MTNPRPDHVRRSVAGPFRLAGLTATILVVAAAMSAQAVAAPSPARAHDGRRLPLTSDFNGVTATPTSRWACRSRTWRGRSSTRAP